MYRLIILDADGTLTPSRNGSTGDFEEQLLPGVALKIKELREAGVTLVIASNQSQKRSQAAIERQLDWTCRRLNLNAFRYETRPDHKKPSPFMLTALMWRWQSAPADTLFVGDAETDKEAAAAAGCDFMFADKFFGGDYE